MSIETKGYAHPDVLVSTDWVADHLNDANVRLVESNEDILLYDTGHILGAVKIDWHVDLNDPLVREGLQDEYFYFVHSYFVDPADEKIVIGKTEYAETFCSVIRKDNIMAAQFHPEKSQKAGMRFLEIYFKCCKDVRSN